MNCSNQIQICAFSHSVCNFVGRESECPNYWKNAYTEFAQVAAVAIRLMEKVRKEHLERKDGANE